MISESQSWTQDHYWSSLIENNNNHNHNITPETELDVANYLSHAAAFPLESLFGHDAFDFNNSILYDEFNFVPDQTVEPSDLINQNYNPTMINEPLMEKRRSSNSSTSSLSSYSSSSEEEEDDNTFSTLYSQRSTMDSSDEEQENDKQSIINPSFIHRRQMEEAILEKITHQLDAEKLPGILSIIAEKHEDHVEEVEIDLARLKYTQLEQILLYIEACLAEREGGPKVKLADFVPKTKPCKSQNSRRRKQRRSSALVETGHIVNGSNPSRLSDSHGPISMSALTALEREEEGMTFTKRKNNRRKGPKKNKSKFNKMTPPAKKLPKRKTAIHKRRLLEEMIQPSQSEDEDEEDDTKEGGIIIFGNEQMDFAVKDNQTIVHTSSSKDRDPILPAIACIEDEDEDDEMIDIML